MSYRTIKRLLGETSLERKCRLLLGGGFLILILVGFFFANRQTEGLVWDQNARTGELLVDNILREKHLRGLVAEFQKDGKPKDDKKVKDLAEYVKQDVSPIDSPATTSKVFI